MIVTRGDGLAATVDPQRGGKIVSLVDATGREWLAPPAGPSAAGRRFVDAEMGGWDECAPSIVACEVAGRRIPDHGDLWDTEFESDGATVRGHGDGYVLSRTVVTRPGGIRLNYRAQATRGPLPFLWAAHPQFLAPPGTRVVLPADVTRIVDALAPEPVERPFAPDDAAIDSVPPRAGRKFYAAPETQVTETAVVRADGANLTLRWSDACPYLGVWFDNRAYSREPVIAVEPSTGYFDSLETAVRLGRVAVLHVERPLEWWIELTVDPGL